MNPKLRYLCLVTALASGTLLAAVFTYTALVYFGVVPYIQ